MTTTDGTLDPTFGDGGVVAAGFTQAPSARTSVQPDGKVLLGVGTNTPTLARYR